ncbi:unnamed protein product [Pseudo-nitzschia multistriata]|uniref:Cytochrome b5 heme-binding domain-containing protein n=1 Tax=Pseudo-nitzschia multistriata TaxID=183589 RepID=A0A448ZQD0_9STRA|nr:unnamed protein product [Pseudo-nitzschia multistriata]
MSKLNDVNVSDIVGSNYEGYHEATEGEDVSSNNSTTASISSSASFSSDDIDGIQTSSPTVGNSLDGKSKDLWWIHGNGYDLMDFVKDHPGGIEAILLGKGRDCTALVESYHAFSGERVWKILEKHRVVQEEHEQTEELAGVSARRATPIKQHPGRVPDFFYEILKERVTKALRSKGIDPVRDRGASTIRIAYYILIFGSWLYTGYLHCSGSTFGSFAFALVGWLMGALGHDAGHFAASRRAAVNEYGVWAMSNICNPVMWQQQHTYAHHSYTNEFDRDPDLHHFDLLLRVHKKFNYQPKYRWQSSFLYVLFAYMFVVFGTCLWIPWGVLSEGTLYGMVDWHDKDRPMRYYGMWFHLLLYIGIIVIVPIFTHESFVKAALATYIHIATIGITFAFFSQINHLNEHSLETDMVSREKQYKKLDSNKQDPRLASSWAAAQVETSNNFASQSIFWHVLSNGLNHQIEHHLFPGLNHGHLEYIAPVVKQTCEEFGVGYKSYDTWSDLLNATLEWYDKLSVGGDIDDDVAAAVPDIKRIKIS